MKNYQYILLDWDGNLAKTLDVWLDASRYPLEKRGVYISDIQIAIQCFGRPFEGYRELGVEDIDAAILEMDTRAKKLMPDVELYPDALFVLEEIKKLGKQTALITSSLRENVVPILDKFHVHNFFDVVITNEDTELRKPHPEPILKALKMLGGTAEEAILIGDSDKDINSSNNAGIDSILFFPDEHKKFYDLAEMHKLKPTYVIDDFRKVIDIITSKSGTDAVSLNGISI